MTEEEIHEFTKPDLKGLTFDQLAYVQKLEKQVSDLVTKIDDMLDEDSVRGTYYILNAKLKESIRIINDYKIKIDDSDSKAYERFWKTFIDIKEVVGNVTWLKSQVFFDKTEAVITNPMEKYAKSKKDNK